MDIQLTKISNEIGIDSNYKKEQILRFIKEKKRVTRSEITRFCEHKIASKITVDKIVKELLDDNQILQDVEHRNSRNKYLVINNENVLQNVKFELSEIKNLFSKFLEKLKEIYIKPPQEWPISSNKKMDYLRPDTLYTIYLEFYLQY